MCSHHCHIPPGGFGVCGVRENKEGALYTHAYGRLIAANVDPVEKKPLYHFLPGTTSFSVATIGCNFRCGFCQNWEISQVSAKGGYDAGQPAFPEQIAEKAKQNGCRSVSYTYTEPTIFFEYAEETAGYAKKRGLANIFVSNGYMTPEAARRIMPVLDAANIDLKFFNDDSYRRICFARLAPVLATIELMRSLGIWVEVTTLVVPGQNDSEKELTSIARFLAGIDVNIPWHISRFYPNFKMSDGEPTPEKTLKRAAELGAEAGLRFVYVGNVHGWGSDTRCPSCSHLLIKRNGFAVETSTVNAGKCPRCGEKVPGVF